MDVIYIYYNIDENLFSGPQYKNYLAALPCPLQEAVERVRVEKARHLKLKGLLLIEKALIKLGYSKDLMANIQYNEYGKPSIEDAMAFNITHSGDLVACAFQKNGTIGLDTEKIRSIKPDRYKIAMTEDELRKIYGSANIEKEFFRYWTIKESFIKAVGKGMAIPLKELIILEETISYKNEEYFYKNTYISEGYITHVCSKVPVVNINTENVVL